MSLQDEVNMQVAAIQADLEAAGEEMPEEQGFLVQIDFGPARSALTAAADQIDALSGDSSALRTAIAAIEDQQQQVVIPFGEQNAAIGSSVSAGQGMVSLLISQSNFDGLDQ